MTHYRYHQTIRNVASDVFDWVEEMDWHNKTPLECIALIASEVGEAANECRGAVPSNKLGAELADIILRTLDLGESLGIDLGEEIELKMQENRAKGNHKNREK